MPAKIILNPYSNRWGAGKMADAAEKTLQDLGYDFELVQTRTPNEAIAMAREAAEADFDPIVAAGGDGTISEVVNGVLASGKADAVRIGILPLGSANDYAYQLGLPLDLEGACRALIEAKHVRTLDAGRVNNRLFINDVTIAFGARVNIEAATIKRLRGSLIYLGGVFKALMRYRLPTATFEWDGGKLENKPFLLAYVGIGWRTGGVFFLTPDAKPDDGLLDFIVADAVGRLRILQLLPKTFNGSHMEDPRVTMAHCTRLTITSNDPLPVLADGEIIYRDVQKLDIEILPAAVQVITGAEERERPER